MSRSTPHLPSPTPYCYPLSEELPPITHASSKSEWTPEWTPIHPSPTSFPSPPTMPSSPLSVPVNNESQHSTTHEDFARHSRCQRATQRAVQSKSNTLYSYLPRPSKFVGSSPLPASNQRTASPVQASTLWWQPELGLDDELRRQIEEPQPQQQYNTLHGQQSMVGVAPASQPQKCCHPYNATAPTRAHDDLATLSQRVERIQSDLERIQCDQKQLNGKIATEIDIIALRTELLERIRKEIREELRKLMEKKSFVHMKLKEEIGLQIRQDIAKALDAKNEESHSKPTTSFDNLEQSTDTSINTSVGDLEQPTDVTAEAVEKSVISQRKEMQDLTHGTSISFYLLCEELRTKIAKMNTDFSDMLSRINDLEKIRLGAVETHIKEKFRDVEDMAWSKMTTDWESVQESEED
ncbi:hypothetical protein BDV97DRAFT_349382 [Delphinella strobiligena]|nr:hypothetical protein BDV97DRAFT_349382 [Delphinella strobiligena]